MAGDRRHAGVFCMGERFNVVTGLAVQPRPDHSLRGILGSVGTEHCPSPPTLMPRVPQTLCSGTAGIRPGFQTLTALLRILWWPQWGLLEPRTQLTKPGWLVYNSHLSNQEAEAGGSVQGHP